MAITRVITDNDGVNIDSEDLAMRIMDDEGAALIAQYNPALLQDMPADHIYKTFPGTSTDKIVKALIEGDWEKTGVKNPERELPLPLINQDNGFDLEAPVAEAATKIADEITIATIRRFEVELKSIPGTTEAWQSLSDTLGAGNIALATTSRGDRMDVSVNHAVDPASGKNARLAEFFPEGERRFSGYGGPNKYDAFFEKTGWDPKECAIVEDSLSGVRYAKSGRPDTKVIGTVAANFYEDKSAHASDLMANGADIVVSSMHDLPKAVEWLNNGMEVAKKPDFTSPVFTKPPEAQSNAPTASASAAIPRVA